MKFGFSKYITPLGCSGHMKVIGANLSRDDLLDSEWSFVLQVWFGYFYVEWDGGRR